MIPETDGMQALVAALLPLYAEVTEDVPEAVGAHLPNSECVIAAFEHLMDVILPPGRACGQAPGQPLASYFESHLYAARRLLLDELQRALPLRITGAYARRLAQQTGVVPPDLPAEVLPVLAGELADRFFATLPEIRRKLILDVRAAYNGDPAAVSFAEVMLTYPGLWAVAAHRLAHELFRLGIPAIPRIISEHVHGELGVDIHPGATIGEGFFIDHATGVVIGETANVGRNVKLYQGVTLGARSFPLDELGYPQKGIRRHPTVEDGVVVYANATILGDIVIGAYSEIGGNVFLYESVPPYSRVLKRTELEVRRLEGA